MAKVEGRTKSEAININNISYLLASLVLAGILGLSAIPVRADDGFVPEEVILPTLTRQTMSIGSRQGYENSNQRRILY